MAMARLSKAQLRSLQALSNKDEQWRRLFAKLGAASAKGARAFLKSNGVAKKQAARRISKKPTPSLPPPPPEEWKD